MTAEKPWADLSDEIPELRFPCVELVEPGPEELSRIGERFSLHELAIEDAIKAHQRPKLERYGDSVLLVLKTARYNDEAETVESGEILLLFGKDFLVIVRHDPAYSLDLESSRGPGLDDAGPGVMVHRVIDQIVDDYAPVVSGFEADVEEVEETVFSEDVYPTERIYRLKRELLAFLHNTRPAVEPLSQLREGGLGVIDHDLEEYFRDVEDHLRRVVDRIERVSALTSEVLDANLTQVSLRQNEDMRKISAWAAIVLLPTVLSGIWGMNFEHMPELDWTYGYPMAIGVMILGTGLLYWLLRRAGWL